MSTQGVCARVWMRVLERMGVGVLDMYLLHTLLRNGALN